MKLRWLDQNDADMTSLQRFLEETSDTFDPPLGDRVDLAAYPKKLLTEGRVLVAEPAVGDIGAAVAVYCQPERFEYAFIPYIAVRDVGRGLGRVLLAKACDMCRESGSVGVKAQTALSNARSRRLFSSCGFKEAGTSDNRGNGESSVMLTLSFDE